MKILLISGHGAGDPGACSNYGIEATETRRVVAEMLNQFKRYKGVEVDVYPTNRNAYEDVKNGYAQVNFANYSYVFEVHFNSASVSANGVEVWVTPNEGATTVEQNIVNKVAALGFANRGVKKEYFTVITSAKNKGVSSALAEVCFISNQSDMEKYNSKFTQICGAMVDGIAEGFGLVKNETQQTINNKGDVDMDKLVCYFGDADVFAAIIVAQKYGCPMMKLSDYKASGLKAKEIIQIGGNPNDKTRYDTFKNAAKLV